MKKASKAGAQHQVAQHHDAGEPAEHPVERVHAPKKTNRPATDAHKMPRSYSYRTAPRQGG
jgi:hypothetical protein